MSSSIPIKNLYYLFCYAWDRFPEGQGVGVGTGPSPDIWDLFASVLLRGVTQLMRRGLDRGYVEFGDDSPTIRGRIALRETMQLIMARRPRAHCWYDELQHDVIPNQLIKATLRALASNPDIAPAHREGISRLVRALPQISDVRLSRALFGRLQLSRNNGHYDLLLRICDLIYSALLPAEEGSSTRFASILADEHRMYDVFEAFVRNFYKAEQTEFVVSRQRIKWRGHAVEPLHELFLPGMNTDVTLRSATRSIVLDAKFYPKAFDTRFGQEKIRSDHMYQLHAYLTNFDGGHEGPAEGILLYPSTGRSFDLKYVIGQHPIRIASIDLDQPWERIHEDLLSLLAR